MAKGVKTGGRRAGVPNKAPSLASISQLCEERGFNPFVRMIEIASGASNPPADIGTQGKMAAELAKYLEPQKKAMELSNPEGQMLRIEVTYAGRDND